MAIVITVPLGLACAVFLNETSSRAADLVRTVVDAMTALPSILAGLFIFATWILILGFERSALAASPRRQHHDAADHHPLGRRGPAPGAGQPQGGVGRARCAAVAHGVARRAPDGAVGLATAVILGVARGVGETAPVLLTAGFTASLNVNPFKNPMVSLPLATFEFVRSPQPALIARGFATAAVLMVLVLVLFAVARMLGGHPAGHVTGRQAAPGRGPVGPATPTRFASASRGRDRQAAGGRR